MMFIENRIPREIYWSGFGFQIWLQMMTQMINAPSESLLVMDEPDIYLHPDLQRKLVRVVTGKFAQYFIATHSTEIINEVPIGNVASVSKGAQRAHKVGNDEGYRKLLFYIGSSENAEFSRIARAKRIIFFEGKDKKIYQCFAKKLAIKSVFDEADTLFLQSGGFSQWSRVKNVNWTLDKVFNIDVSIVAIFDRDYLCDAEIAKFAEKMSEENLLCEVLDRKEIENYALVDSVLIRLLQERAQSSGKSISADEANQVLSDLIEDFRQEVYSKRFSAYELFERNNKT